MTLTDVSISKKVGNRQSASDTKTHRSRQSAALGIIVTISRVPDTQSFFTSQETTIKRSVLSECRNLASPDSTGYDTNVSSDHTTPCIVGAATDECIRGTEGIIGV